MAWLDFPFPSCPGCARSWETSAHRDCPATGNLNVDPDTERVRCEGCSDIWDVADSRFYCLCGHQFSAAEVADALAEMIRAAAVLDRLLRQNATELARIQDMGRGSLTSWLERLVSGFAGGLGKAMGFIVGSVLRGWDKL
ncbi:hypothetical protein ACH5A2_18270 [Streptomyces collinus]|uniref:hypothetical protein n=1 Tax=Streptomyces collinus TaxID=42684 RepID=UPI0037B7E628